MAINPSTEFTGRITAPTTAYPYGSAKNESTPGAGDGTPYRKVRADDIFGFQQALLKSRAIVPTGNADEVRASQYLQAVVEIAAGAADFYTDSGAADAYVLDVANADSQGPEKLFDGMRARFVVANPNTGGPATVNPAGLGVTPIKAETGADPLAGQLSGTVELRYDSTNAWFTIVGSTLGAVFRSKAEAVSYITTHGIVNGQSYSITSDDGDAFTGITGAAPGTYANNSTIACGTILIPSGGDGSSAIVRNGYVDGELYGPWFGIVYDDATDNGTAIAEMEAALPNGGVIKHPEGSFRLTSLTIKNQIIHEGIAGRTTLRCLASASAFITLDSGPVTKAGFRNMQIAGAESATPSTAINSAQWAFDLQAVADASTTGGWWEHVMDNVRVTGFDNIMDLNAGDNALLPHQFGFWRDVTFIRNDAGGKCLRMQRQVEQITGVRCRFDAVGGSATGSNVECVTGTLFSPARIVFIGGSIQNSDYAIVSGGSQGVKFVDTWFENIKRCVTLSGYNPDFEFGGRLANAANGGGTGYLISATGTGNAKLASSTILGTTDKIVNSLAAGFYFDSEPCAGSSTATASTTGVVKQISESSGVLSCGLGKRFLVNTSANNITTINSDLLAGDFLFLMALGGTIKLATGGNISLGTSASPLTIAQNETVLLVRDDLLGTFDCVGK